MKKLITIILFLNFLLNAYSQFQIVASDSINCGSLTTRFELNNYNDVDSVFWNFGNNISAQTLISDSITYDVGSYHIACQIYHDGDKISTINNNNFIQVYPLPKAEFEIIDSVNENSYKVALKLEMGATTDSIYHTLTFGDGYSVSSMKKIVAHTYNESGSYEILNESVNRYECTASHSDTVNINDQFIVPNVFTPNNDGMNDLFKVRTNGNSKFELQIYTRTGTLVHKTTSSNPSWDGTSNYGADLPTGVYYYVISDMSNDSQNKTGFMHLYR